MNITNGGRNLPSDLCQVALKCPFTCVVHQLHAAKLIRHIIPSRTLMCSDSLLEDDGYKRLRWMTADKKKCFQSILDELATNEPPEAPSQASVHSESQLVEPGAAAFSGLAAALGSNQMRGGYPPAPRSGGGAINKSQLKLKAARRIVMKECYGQTHDMQVEPCSKAIRT